MALSSSKLQKKEVDSRRLFRRSKLSLRVCLRLLYCWAAEIPVTHIRAQIGSAVSVKCAVDYYNFCRAICTTHLLENEVHFGGPGVIVQIDESSFSRDKKVQRTCIGLLIFDHWLVVREREARATPAGFWSLRQREKKLGTWS